MKFRRLHSFDTTTNALKMERIADWASRSRHVVTVVGKQLTAAFDVASARRARCDGCSASGHAGMLEAQRYPRGAPDARGGARAMVARKLRGSPRIGRRAAHRHERDSC